MYFPLRRERPLIRHRTRSYFINQFLDSTSDHPGGEGLRRIVPGSVLRWPRHSPRSGEVGELELGCHIPGDYSDMGVSLHRRAVNPATKMLLTETVATYNCYLKELIWMVVAYITLVRCLENADVVFDCRSQQAAARYPTSFATPSGKKRATPHDVLETDVPLFKHPPTRATTKPFLNAGLSPNEASELVGSGEIEPAAFACCGLRTPTCKSA